MTSDLGSDADGRWWLPAGVVAVVVIVWLAFIHPIVHLDVEVFLRAGAAINEHRDPYPPPGSATVYSGSSFVYPYLVGLPFAWLARLHGSAGALFIAVSLLAIIGGARLCGAQPRAQALLLLSSSTIIGLQMGTLNGLMFLGLAALWRLRDRPVAAGILAALVIYSKVLLAPVWVWLLLTRRTGAALVGAAATALLLAVGAVVGPIGTGTYLRLLDELGRHEAHQGMSLTGLLMNIGAGAGAATWVARLAAVATMAACWWVARRTGDERVLFAGCVVAALVASPVVWAHYLLLLAVPLLLTAREPESAMAVFTVGTWCVVTPHGTNVARVAVYAALLAVVLAPVVRRWVATVRDGTVSPPARSRAALVVAGASAAIGAGFALRALATGPYEASKVPGAYCAALAMAAMLVWIGMRARSAPVRTSIMPLRLHRMAATTRPVVEERP